MVVCRCYDHFFSLCVQAAQFHCRHGVVKIHFCNHMLNGSSSPVLTATSLSYGKVKNSTPHRIKTPDPIEIKFGTVDYVGEGTRHAKFYANPFKGGASRQMGEICLLYTSPSPRD